MKVCLLWNYQYTITLKFAHFWFRQRRCFNELILNTFSYSKIKSSFICNILELSHHWWYSTHGFTVAVKIFFVSKCLSIIFLATSFSHSSPTPKLVCGLFTAPQIAVNNPRQPQRYRGYYSRFWEEHVLNYQLHLTSSRRWSWSLPMTYKSVDRRYV